MKAGLDKDPDVVSQLSLMRENLVAQRPASEDREGHHHLRRRAEEEVRGAKRTSTSRSRRRHILIAFKGSPAAQEGKPELTEEQAKAKAEELHKQIVGGASFEELAKKESDDVGSGARGGDLGEFGRGQMVPEFEKAAFEAKVGEVTPVVRTQFGYHIIKVDEHGIDAVRAGQADPREERAPGPHAGQARRDEDQRQGHLQRDVLRAAARRPLAAGARPPTPDATKKP